MEPTVTVLVMSYEYERKCWSPNYPMENMVKYHQW